MDGARPAPAVAHAADPARAPARVSLVLLALALAAQAWFLSTPLAGPFAHGFLGHNAARYALAGRNYVRHGFLAHGGIPDLTPGAAEVRPHLYAHHPPLAPLLVGAAFAVAGESERSAQWPFLVAGLLVTGVVFLLVRALRGGIAPGAAAVIAGLVPMGAYYGGHVDPQGPVVQLSMVLVTLAWLAYRRSGRTASIAGAVAALVLGLLSDWSAAYLAAFVPVAEILWPSGRGVRRLLVLPLAAVLFAGAFCVWIEAGGASVFGDVIGSAGIRSPFALFSKGAGPLGPLVRASLGNVVDLFTWPVLALAVFGLLREARSGDAGGSRTALRPAVFALGCSGLVHVALFPAGWLVHDYWTYLLLPPLALLAAVAIEDLRRIVAARAGGVAGALAAVLLIGAVAASGARATRSRFAVAEPEHAALARALAPEIPASSKVATNIPFYNPTRSDLLVIPEFTWYLDRIWRGAVTTDAEFRRAQAEEGPFDLFLYAPLGPESEPAWVGALRATHPNRTFPLFGQTVVLITLNG